MPKRFFALVSCTSSVMLHLCALGAIAAWSLLAFTESPKLGASPGHVTIEVTMSEPEDALSPVELAISHDPVVITPHRAEAMQRRFVNTPSPQVPLEKLLTRDVLDKIFAEATEAPAEARPLPKEPATLAMADKPTTQQQTPRLASARRPKTLQVKVAPVTVEQPSPETSGVRTSPSFAGNRPPSYPAAARRNGWEGTVMLRLEISATGAVTKVEVARSSGHAILDAEAVATVRTWRGEPATHSGRPIPTTELLPVRFRMR